MTTKNLVAKIEKAKLNRNDSNCLGTALYLIGACDVDEEVTYSEFPSHLTQLTKVTTNSEVGDLMAFGDKKGYFHAGVILDPIKKIICHRRDIGEGVFEDPIETLGDIMGGIPGSLFYRQAYSKPDFYRVKENDRRR